MHFSFLLLNEGNRMLKVIGLLDLCAQISRISEVPEGIGTIARYLCGHMLAQTARKDTILLA